MTKTLTLNTPLDMHLHLRDDEMLKLVAPLTSATFKGAIIMPNLVPPVTTKDEVIAYKNRICDAVEDDEAYECPECGAVITLDMTACPSCGVGLSFEIEEVEQDDEDESEEESGQDARKDENQE